MYIVTEDAEHPFNEERSFKVVIEMQSLTNKLFDNYEEKVPTTAGSGTGSPGVCVLVAAEIKNNNFLTSHMQ